MKTITNLPENPIDRLKARAPFLWINDKLARAGDVLPARRPSRDDLEDAAARLSRFAPLIESLFADTQKDRGIIESDLISVPNLRDELSRRFSVDIRGALWLKADHALPVAGSVKARGGVYEVLAFAERLAMREGLFTTCDPYLKLASPEIRRLFSRYTIAVGSTGNLGLSIGIMGTALGFSVTVHMSRDAKQWKKQLLRKKGVTVVEHESDYSAAVSAGRQAAGNNPFIYFVDDESSIDLFLGYSVAALRLSDQLHARGISIGPQRPLFVYLPCGVGGAPGGITFGLKHVFGDDAHCFFAEPTESPSFMLGMLMGFDRPVSVYEIGLSNNTQADGLAVPAASLLAGAAIGDLVSGCLTVDDEDLFRFVYALFTTEGIAVEPSAAAGFAGPLFLFTDAQASTYLHDHRIADCMDRAVHLLWTTGGQLVPPEQFEDFMLRGKRAYARHKKR
jgi:D-serine dehydratase